MTHSGLLDLSALVAELMVYLVFSTVGYDFYDRLRFSVFYCVVTIPGVAGTVLQTGV